MSCLTCKTSYCLNGNYKIEWFSRALEGFFGLLLCQGMAGNIQGGCVALFTAECMRSGQAAWSQSLVLPSTVYRKGCGRRTAVTGSEQGTVAGWCQSCRLVVVVDLISIERFLSKTFSVQACWWVHN